MGGRADNVVFTLGVWTKRKGHRHRHPSLKTLISATSTITKKTPSLWSRQRSFLWSSYGDLSFPLSLSLSLSLSLPLSLSTGSPFEFLYFLCYHNSLFISISFPLRSSPLLSHISRIPLLLLNLLFYDFLLQADVDEPAASGVQPKKRTFKKFSFRGVDLDALLDMSSKELVELFHARARRRLVYIFLIFASCFL